MFSLSSDMIHQLTASSEYIYISVLIINWTLLLNVVKYNVFVLTCFSFSSFPFLTFSSATESPQSFWIILNIPYSWDALKWTDDSSVCLSAPSSSSSSSSSFLPSLWTRLTSSSVFFLLLISSLALRLHKKAVTVLSSFSSSSSSFFSSSHAHLSLEHVQEWKIKANSRHEGDVERTALKTFIWRSWTLESHAQTCVYVCVRMCVWENPSVFFIIGMFLKSERLTVSSLSSFQKIKMVY